MTTMVDDEVLCHALGNSETMVLFDQGQREIDAGRDAGGSPYVASRQKMRSALDPYGWIVSLKASGKSPMWSLLGVRPAIQPPRA